MDGPGVCLGDIYCPFWRVAIDERMWARILDADTGAGCGPGSAAEIPAARAWTNAPIAAAWPGGSPAASRDPMIPDRTSPDPAVEAQD